MKVLYIVNVRIPTERAHGLQIVKTVESFILAGADVKLLLPKRRNLIKENIESYYDLETSLKIFYLKNYFAFLENVNVTLYFVLQRFFFNIGALIYSMRENSDFIYSRDITICFLLSLFGKKVIFEDHEPKLSKKWLYKFFLKRIKKKVIVAYNLADFYDKSGISKESYIIAQNAVDIEEFEIIKPDKTIWERESGIKSDSKIVLYVGHFYRWKGVYTLVDSASLLDSETKIVLIGGTGEEDQKDVQQYLKDKKIENVFVRNFMLHRDVIKYIKSADILILPNTAKEERSAKYTTPIKLFEYMASGVPIIASRVDSFSNYLKDQSNCLLFEPDNPKDLAPKIDHLLSDKKLADTISQNAYEQAKEYTWNKRANKILAFAKD